MSLAALKEWVNEILTPADLNAEFAHTRNNVLTALSPMTGDLAAGSNKITGLAAATAAGDAVRFEQLGWNLISTQTAASSAAISFTSGFTTTYDEYVFTLSGIVPSLDSSLYMRVSQAAAFASGASYQWVRVGAQTTDVSPSVVSSPADNQIILAAGLGNSAGKVLAGEVRLWNPASTNIPKLFHWTMTYVNSSNNATITTGSGSPTGLGVGAIDGVQFFTSVGTLAIGTIALFGVRKT